MRSRRIGDAQDDLDDACDPFGDACRRADHDGRAPNGSLPVARASLFRAPATFRPVEAGARRAE